jgi:predicted nuclease of predicted toxin-antitoxin system
MRLLFIVDNMLPRDLAEYLTAAGHEAITTRRLKISSDELIWRHAEKLGAVVISKDADYLPLEQQLTNAQFVHLRFGNLSTADLMKSFKARFPRILQSLKNGEKIVDVE